MLDLSPEQKAAVQYVKGPLLVLAGAGSGKTSLLTHKIVWLLREYGVDAAAMLVLAVNTHTARAIRTGVREILGRKVADLRILTFSEFALRIVQQRPEALGLRPGFSLYDQTEGEAVIARLLREDLPQAVEMAGDVWRSIAEYQRGPGSPPPSSHDPPPLEAQEIAKWLYPKYEQRLRVANAVDVVDLAHRAVRLLALEAALLPEGNRRRLRFLLVDEYEQTGDGEQEIIRLLAADGVGLTVAGDNRQPAGEPGETAPDRFARLQTQLADVRVLRLTQNFRSTGRMLKAVQCLIDPAGSEADAASSRARLPGARLRILQVRSEQHEPESVVQALLDHKLHHDIDYRHYAVLFRRPEQAAAFARTLQAYRVPYHLRGASTFFDQTEVRDFWAYLKLLCNPADDNAFLRAISTPRRDIEHETLARLMRFAAERGRSLLESALDPQLQQALTPAQYSALRIVATMLHTMIERAAHAEPVQLACDLLAQLRYEDWLRDTCNDLNIAARRMENVMRLVDMLGQLAQKHPDVGLRALIAELNVGAILDPQGEDFASDGVALVSLGAAHGMEFAHVYLAGLEEAPGPVVKPATKAERTEQRRLLYIALTRARESLTFTLAEQRAAAPRAAPFLGGLGAHDIEWIHANPGSLFAERRLGGAGQSDPVRRYFK